MLGRASLVQGYCRVARIALYSEGVLLSELGRVRTLVRIRISTTGRVTIVADGRLQNAAEPRKQDRYGRRDAAEVDGFTDLQLADHGSWDAHVVDSFPNIHGARGRAIDYLDANFDRFP